MRAVVSFRLGRKLVGLGFMATVLVNQPIVRLSESVRSNLMRIEVGDICPDFNVRLTSCCSQLRDTMGVPRRNPRTPLDNVRGA
jgi:hypothetical protein